MWPASDNNANDPVTTPTITCTAKKARINPNETASGLMCRAPARKAAAP